MKFLAFLADSLRETIDKKSFWVLGILALFFILLCWSVSFTPVSPEESLQDVVKSFGMVQHLEGTDFTMRDTKVQFKISDIRQLGPEAEFYQDGFDFTLAASPPGKFHEAVTVDAALRKRKIKKATEDPPGQDSSGNYPEPPIEDQVRFLKKRFQENGFPISEIDRKDVAVYTVRLKPVLAQQVVGGHKMGILFGLTDFHLKGISVARVVLIIEVLLAEWVAGIFGVLVALIFTAFFLPSMLEKGNIEIILSKPIHRALLVVYKYLGGLLYVCLLSVLLIGGSWLALSVRSGYWNYNYLWSIAVQSYHFAILYSVSVLFGVLWRSWIGSVLMTALAWILFTAVNMAHAALHSPQIIAKVKPGWLTFSEVLYYIFPKTWYMGKLNEMMLQKSNVGDALPELGEKSIFDASVTWEMVIFSSLAFIVVMLTLSCWRFAKKDY